MDQTTKKLTKIVNLRPWQLEAAYNTAVNRWPAFPLAPGVYLARLHAPIVESGVKHKNYSEYSPGEEIIGQAGAATVRLRVMDIHISRIQEVRDNEAIFLGLIAAAKYQRGSGRELIRDAWNETAAPGQEYENNPVIVSYAVMRVA